MQFKGTGRLLVKDLDLKQGIVQAYWSAFGNKDDGGDIVEPGCWARTIAERGPQATQPRVKFLYQHQETMVVAKPSELVEDRAGLLATCQIPPTTLGKDVLILYEAGVLTEHSVGYEVVKAQWDSKQSARLLIECTLWEGSVVTWGMNSATPVVSVKALTQPAHLTALATKAAQLDGLLHAGNLQSEALCDQLERELKALQTALAPTQEAASQPYSIQGVLDSMTDLADRLGTKTATQAEKDAQAERAKKYKIAVKDGGNVTKPSKYAELSDDDFADPTNYSYPIDTKAHADNAASRFGDADNRAVYSKAEQAIIDKRIAAAQKKFGEDDSGKAAHMYRAIKGTGGDVEVAEDGSHASYTGTHTHSHKAFGSQGGDAMHEHEHEHKGNARHKHTHPKASGQRPQRKTFQEHLTADMCQDLMTDWHDVIIHSFTCAVVDAFTIGDEPESDVSDALDGLKAAVMEWVANAVKCGLADFLDDQGGNWSPANYPMQYGDDSQPDYYNPFIYGWMSRHPLAMPDAPARLGKAGRTFSSGNRQVITDALDGMSDAMKSMKVHHGKIADLMDKTDPDAVRQDEDDTQGDDDTENGGHDINKSARSSYTTPRRAAGASAAGTTRSGGPGRRDAQASTTHQGTDLSAIAADLDALKSRLLAGKAK